MKKLTLLIMAFVMLAFFMPVSVQAAAATEPTPTTVVMSAEAIRANELLTRLDEINAVDKSNLSTTEKRELRNETRAIKKELRATSGGVYLSVGAILVIILLIVLLL